MTIVCRSKKFIFVHLHKCGGTSVEQAFGPHARWNDLIVGSTRWGEWLQPLYRRFFGLTKHSSARQIRRAVGPDVWSEYWKVALVRHPLRTYESFYGWISELVARYMEKNRIGRDEFVRRYNSNALSSSLARWKVTEAFAASTCFSEFVDVVLKRDLLAATLTDRLSRSGVLIMDDVYKLEEIDRFWDAFEAQTDLKIERLHANRSMKQDYQWDERHIEEMYRRFEVDFVNFKYE